MHNVSFHDLKFKSVWVWSCWLIESCWQWSAKNLDWVSLCRYNSFCGPQTVFGPRKKPCIYKVRVFKGPASNFGFTFTENLHCALRPSQLNWSLAKKTLRSCPIHTADTTSSSTPRWHFVVGKVQIFWEGLKNLKISPNFIWRFFSKFKILFYLLLEVSTNLIY